MEIPASAGMTGRGARAADNPSSRRKSGSPRELISSSRRKSGSLCQFVSSSRRKVGISVPVCLVIPTKSRDLSASLSCHPDGSRDLCASLSRHPDEKSGSLCQFVLSSRRKSRSLHSEFRISCSCHCERLGMERHPAVYILTNRFEGTLYVGVTSNLPARVWQHRQRLADGFANRYGLHRLVWFEMHDSMYAAITREKQIKEWRRAWKLELINTANPEWRDLWGQICR